MIPAAPRLRFPEFKDPWKPGHAGDAFKNSRAKGAAGLPIYSVTMDRGLVRRDSIDRHMAADAADGQNLRAQRGDVVYNMMRMWQGAVGLAPEECMVSPAYVVLSPKKHTSPEFFDQWFKAKRMLYLLGAYSHGITSDRLRLYADDFSRIPLNLPSLPEQQKIAAFLGVVDARLAALAAKQAALGRFKAGLMQKLFSQQIRFMRDDGKAFPDWLDKRLGDVANIVGGGTPESHIPEYWDGDIVWFTPTEIKSKYLQRSKRTISVSGLKNSSAKLLPVGALLLSTRATIGDVGIATVECCTNQGFQSLIVKSENNNEFWYYWLIHNKKALLRKSSGSTFLEIGKSEVLKLSVEVPHPDEQKMIADALAAMDAKIQAVADQVTKLQTFKKGLLQQMFV